MGLTPQLLPQLPPGLFPPVLWRIVKELPEKLDQRYADMTAAERLFGDLPELISVFQEAWASGTFRRIRNLGTLRFDIVHQILVTSRIPEILQAVTPHKSKRTRMSDKQVEEQSECERLIEDCHRLISFGFCFRNRYGVRAKL